MASFSNFLRARDSEFFDLFERAGANLVHAAQLLDDMLGSFPESKGLAGDPHL